VGLKLGSDARETVHDQAVTVANHVWVAPCCAADSLNDESIEKFEREVLIEQLVLDQVIILNGESDDLSVARRQHL
jgi:hypothetical protein